MGRSGEGEKINPEVYSSGFIDMFKKRISYADKEQIIVPGFFLLKT
jgi:hypothetical protein